MDISEVVRRWQPGGSRRRPVSGSWTKPRRPKSTLPPPPPARCPPSEPCCGSGPARCGGRRTGAGTSRPPDSLGRQQLMNSGELQALDVEPPVDMVCPRAQQFLAGRLRLRRAGAADCRQTAELVLGQRDVLPDGFPGQSRPRGYPPPAAARPPKAQPAPQVCPNLDAR